MSAGGALAVGVDVPSAQAVGAGVEYSRQLPAPVTTVVPAPTAPVKVVVVEPNPGVEVTKPVSTADVVAAAKVASYPRRQVSASSSASWLLSGRVGGRRCGRPG